MMCGRSGLSLAVVALGSAFLFPQEAIAFAASKLSPHRAIYEMTLDEARSASGVTGIDGRMVFEFTGSPCDGYSLNMRMVTQMTDAQGQTNLTDLRSSTWEQGDRKKFRFQSAQYLNDKLGIRLQALMDLPMRLSGLWVGTGGGGASFVVPVWQFDFTAGVFLRLGS